MMAKTIASNTAATTAVILTDDARSAGDRARMI
jgi:hypothetical protein